MATTYKKTRNPKTGALHIVAQHQQKITNGSGSRPSTIEHKDGARPVQDEIAALKAQLKSLQESAKKMERKVVPPKGAPAKKTKAEEVVEEVVNKDPAE